MPIATPERYAEMLEKAKAGGYAYPSVNVTSSQTLNAALRGFAEADSDGIVQVSTGGAAFLSGTTVKDMVSGAVALAEFARVVAEQYPVHVALHTDHCPKQYLDSYLRPLIGISEGRVSEGKTPLFGSHMWDGSALPLPENLEVAADLLPRCAAAQVILEVEIGVVGGEEDDVVGKVDAKLYSTPEDAREESPSDRRCWRRSKTRWGRRTGGTSPSTSSSTGAQDLGSRTSVRRSPTAW
jgi:fructose-bisphosphate aldolase class II